MLDGDEDPFIHRSGFRVQGSRFRVQRSQFVVHQANMDHNQYAFSAAIATATGHASAFTHHAFAKGPIFSLSLVNATSETTANDRWRLRITWLTIISCPVPRSP